MYCKTLSLLLLVIAFHFSACTKDSGAVRSNQVNNNTPAPAPYIGGIVVGNKEYFWNRAWQPVPGGYELTVKTQNLTQASLGRGINVHVAVFTEMTTFSQLPFTYTWLQDTVNLSCTAIPAYDTIPGRVTVHAISSANLATTFWNSDLMIEYR